VSRRNESEREGKFQNSNDHFFPTVLNISHRFSRMTRLDMQCSLSYRKLAYYLVRRTYVRFEVFTAVTMKNGFFWDVPPCGSCMNRGFRGT
jgi:hypothetical protein